MKRQLSCALVLLALAGCSSSPPAQNSPTAGVQSSSAAATPTNQPSLLPAGKFKLTTKSGAQIAFTLPTPATDKEVAGVEAFRVKTGAAAVSYLVADVDNRLGTDFINMYSASAFDQAGRKYTFMGVDTFIDQWSPKYGADGNYRGLNGQILDAATGNALEKESVDLYNAHINGAQIAERATFVLASKDVDLPAAFTRVTVAPKGAFEEEVAQPVQ